MAGDEISSYNFRIKATDKSVAIFAINMSAIVVVRGSEGDCVKDNSACVCVHVCVRECECALKEIRLDVAKHSLSTSYGQ